jgi:uncharacterized protein YlxW (UPF0749 family)
MEPAYQVSDQQIFMNRRDQVLVLNIVDYLTASGGNPSAAEHTVRQLRQWVQGSDGAEPPSSEDLAALEQEVAGLKGQVRQLEKQLEAAHQSVADRQEAFESQGEMLRMTVTYLDDLLTGARAGQAKAENYLAQMRRQDGLLREQVESYSDMFQMTINYLEDQSQAANDEVAALRRQNQQLAAELAQVRHQYQQPAESAMSVANGATLAHFSPLPKLKKLFADAVLVTHPEFTNGNVFCVTEKLGIIYLAMVKTPYTGLHGETFSLVSNFYLQNVISNQKYINSSRLIERYAEFVQAMSAHTQAIDAADMQLAVCLVDSQNCEVEFSTTGMSLYTLVGGTLGEHPGGPSGMGTGAVLQNNAYKVKKLNLRKGGQLLLSTSPMSQAYVVPDAPHAGGRPLGEVVVEALGQPGQEAAQIGQFLGSHVPQDASDKDFLLVSVRF